MWRRIREWFVEPPPPRFALGDIVVGIHFRGTARIFARRMQHVRGGGAWHEEARGWVYRLNGDQGAWFSEDTLEFSGRS